MTNTQKPKRGYKWIQKEIESLDPYKDYEQIFRIATSYGPNDFISNLFYTLIFPNFIVTEHGARAIWREDGGKLLYRSTARMEDTEHTNAAWWWYGPSDPRCQKSVEKINNLHRYWAKHYPGVFADNDDYLYTLSFIAIFMHRLRLKLGLSGLPTKVKIASHLFMEQMSTLFISEGDVPVHSFPKNFEGCIAFCEEFEGRNHEGSEQGHLCAVAMYEHFAFRWFSPNFRWLGRAIPRTLSLPSTLRFHRVEPANPIIAYVILWMAAIFFWLADNVLPDPQEAWFLTKETMSKEEKTERMSEHRRVDKAYPQHFAQVESMAAGWGGCPFHEQLREMASGQSKAPADQKTDLR